MPDTPIPGRRTNVTTQEPKYEGLPLSGYAPQTSTAVALVNRNKEAEERLLRLMEAIQGEPSLGVDGRWLSIARTHFEQGFMALNRAIFKPGRVALPEDN